MPDRTFEILLKYTRDPAAAEAAKRDLELLGKEGVKAEAQVEEATQKTFTSKKQLKDMVKQLGHEFPLLGQLGRLALNPIVLATAAVTGAFVLFRTRVNELSRSLGGIEMPNFNETQVEHIERFAEAMQKMGGAADQLKGAKTAFEALSKMADFSAGVRKALGAEAPGQAERAKAALMISQAEILERGGKPGSEANDKSALANAKAAAEAAEKELAITNARLADLLRYQGGEMGWFEQRKFGVQYAARYGYNVSVPGAIAMERGNVADQQAIIGRYAAAQIGAGDRSGRRADLERAGELRREAQELIRTAMVAAIADATKDLKATGAKMDAAASAGDIFGVAQLHVQLARQVGTTLQLYKQAIAMNEQVLRQLNRRPPGR